MILYGMLWRAGAIALGVLCGVLALVSFAPAMLILVVVGSAVLACSATLLSTEDHQDVWLLGVACARTAALGAGGTLAALGIVAAFGPVGLLGFPIVLACSPAAVRWVSQHLSLRDATITVDTTTAETGPASLRSVASPPRQWTAQTAEITRTPRTDSGEPAPSTMTAQELVFAWRLSGIHRGHIHTTADKLSLALHRAYLLDEVERRDPAGFALWMEGSSGAFGDPATLLNILSRRRF